MSTRARRTDGTRQSRAALQRNNIYYSAHAYVLRYLKGDSIYFEPLLYLLLNINKA